MRDPDQDKADDTVGTRQMMDISGTFQAPIRPKVLTFGFLGTGAGNSVQEAGPPWR